MSHVLIIDDDLSICRVLSSIVTKMGYHVDSSITLKSGIDKVYAEEYDIVLLDVNLPDGNGLDMISHIMNAPSQPEVIIVTGNGDPDGAELAIKHKAWDYLEKPVSVKVIRLTLSRVLEYRKEKRKRQQIVSIKRDKIIGNSLCLNRCLDVVANASQTDNNVLIIGETGTGKEIFARSVHENSSRSDNNFIVVDCAALPENLVESVLFGHKKGAFTGADVDRDGLIKMANGGTLFLDEIGELPLSLQKSFLRVLQEHIFRPVGSSNEVQSDFRVVSATNRNLDQMVADGQFRQDLLYRIRTTLIDLPPLRERPDDIKSLATHFMTNVCKHHNISTKGFSPEFIETLEHYRWPGNIRELEHCIMNVLTETGIEPVLYAKHLPDQIRIEIVRNQFKKSRNPDSVAEIEPAFDLSFRDYKTRFIESAEKDYLTNLMSETGWDIKHACQRSDLSRPRLYALLKKYNILRN